MHARDLGDVMASHLKPDESDKMRKGPYLMRQLSVFHTTDE
jgi:hypothetical protein